MIKRYCITLLFSVSSILSTHTMHNQIYLPDFVWHNILKYCSTKQILVCKQVDKQVQKVAEHLLKTDSSKKIIVKTNAEQPPEALLQKVTGLELHLGSNHKVHKYSTYGNSLTSLADIGIELQFDSDHEDCAYFTPAHSITSLISNISHIKALNLKILKYSYFTVRLINKRIAQQLQNLESLKIQHLSVMHYLTYSPDTRNYSYVFDLDNHVADMLNTMPTYAHLKKLHINKGTVPCNTITQIVSLLTTLQVLHIKGNQPSNRVHFYAFIEALQQLTLLQKLCFYITTTIEEKEAHALSKSLATLTHLQILNLRKASISSQGIKILRENCPHISQIYLPMR